MDDKLEFHEYANIYRLMNESELEELKRSIKENGFDENHPIWLYEGKILDGRNRYLAGIAVNAQLHFKQYTGNDPLGFSKKENGTRRHETIQDKALSAEKLATALAKEAKKRQLRTAENREKSESLVTQKFGEQEKGESIKQAAKEMGVNHAYVSDVRKIKEQAPHVYAQMEKGEIKTIPEAKRASGLFTRKVTKEDVATEEILDPELAFIKEKDKHSYDMIKQGRMTRESALNVIKAMDERRKLNRTDNSPETIAYKQWTAIAYEIKHLQNEILRSEDCVNVMGCPPELNYIFEGLDVILQFNHNIRGKK